jgi:serine/threonine protein kinase
LRLGASRRKPDNILVNKSAEVRLIDFLSPAARNSLSKMLHRKRATVRGTRTYMASRLWETLTPQTDIYNFGVTLFELLAGEPP